MGNCILLIGLIAPIIIGGILAIIGFNTYDKDGYTRYFHLPVYGGYVMLISFIFIGFGLLDNARLVLLMRNIGMDTELAIAICVFFPCILTGIIAGITAKSGFNYYLDRKILSYLSITGIAISGVFTHMLHADMTFIRLDNFSPFIIFLISAGFSEFTMTLIDEK